ALGAVALRRAAPPRPRGPVPVRRRPPGPGRCPGGGGAVPCLRGGGRDHARLPPRRGGALEARGPAEAGRLSGSPPRPARPWYAAADVGRRSSTGGAPEQRLADAFTSGARIGAYEVVDRLGAGGMGEVYRARDTRLGRSVAIKVLRTG